jgi:diguanylate cyclase (GGDEF)-like protein/PAS domain S-box-containing protein
MTVVLIVDDQAINLKILSRFAGLIEPDVVAHGFDRPDGALAALDALHPDLIVTDFVMPGMNGEDFVRHCRESAAAADVPIIVITAFEDRDYRYRALDAGASDFLLSPVDHREFVTRARNLLTLRRQQQALRRRADVLEDELASATRHHAEEIQRREQQLRRMINTVPALIRATDPQGRVLVLNKGHRRFFAVDPDQAVGVGEECLFADGGYGERHRAWDLQVLSTGRVLVDMEETVIDRDGRPCVLLTTKAPLRLAEGLVDQVVTVSLDITDRKGWERELRESEQRFRSLVEGSVLGIVIERDGVPVFANRTCARIFGFDTPEQLLALPRLDDLFVPPEVGRLRHTKRLPSAPGHGESDEYTCVRRDGSLIAVEMVTQEVVWGGRPALQSTLADITLRKAYEERLHRRANYDEVTGLPNRVLALDRLRSAVVSAARHHHKGGVLFLDLDNFKKINDTWGHAIGDQLLRQAAERLRSCVREEDTVARLGGDEFTVILPQIASGEHTEPVVHKIIAAFAQPFLLDRQEAFVTASVGITVFPDDSDDPHQLMQNADAAMYRAKEEGRRTYRFFTPELNRRAMERMRMEGHLVHALDRNELAVHYQPIVDLRSGLTEGAEALMRWDNPELGALSPEVFIPLAEDTGLIIPLGSWLLRTACQQLVMWRRRGLSQLTLAVNISARQLREPGLVNLVAEALRVFGLPPESLELEITEGCLMQDVGETAATVHALDQLGVRIALDDFGTGYSCLSYLTDLPVDTVKIDRSFIQGVDADAKKATVVEAILAMAHRMEIRVVAEGVETARELEFIRSRGCHLAQGFLFSVPLPAAAFSEWSFGRTQAVRLAL